MEDGGATSASGSTTDLDQEVAGTPAPGDPGLTSSWGTVQSSDEGSAATTEATAQVAVASATAKTSPAARWEALQLLGAYQEALAVTDELPLFVPVRTTQRRRRLLRQGVAERNLPVRHGDAPELDALWDARDDGLGDACADLADVAWWESEYADFAMRNLPVRYGDASSLGALVDTCQAGHGDACVQLDRRVWWDSDYLDTAEDNRPHRYGGAPSLDALPDACEDGSGEACVMLTLLAPPGSDSKVFASNHPPSPRPDDETFAPLYAACWYDPVACAAAVLNQP